MGSIAKPITLRTQETRSMTSVNRSAGKSFETVKRSDHVVAIRALSCLSEVGRGLVKLFVIVCISRVATIPINGGALHR